MKPSLKRRNDSNSNKKKPPRSVGRPRLEETRPEDLTEDMLMFASLIAKGVSPAEARGIVGISEYVCRRWMKVPTIVDKINELTDEEQSVQALNFLEQKLAKFGGSASLMIQVFAVETRQALHEFFMEKIGKREISWANALALAQQCEEKFGIIVPKEKSVTEVEVTTFDLLKRVPGGREFIAKMEPAQITKQTIRETREDK